MKNHINYIIMLLLLPMVMALDISTITNFPTVMYAGSTYSSQYSFDSNMDGNYYLYANISSLNDNEAIVKSDDVCSYIDNNIWECANTMINGTNTPYLNITTVPNLEPLNMIISVWISLNQTEPINGIIVVDSTDYITTVGNSTNLSQTFNNTQIVTVNATGGTFDVILEISHDFSIDALNLENLTVTTGENSSRTYVIVNGINGIEKTITMPKGIDSGYVCAVDRVIQSVSEISSNCDGINETKLSCDGSTTDGFSCSVINSKYVITGLIHSSVIEVSAPVASTTSSSSSGSSSGSSGGGNSYVRPSTPKPNITPPVLPSPEPVVNKTNILIPPVVTPIVDKPNTTTPSHGYVNDIPPPPQTITPIACENDNSCPVETKKIDPIDLLFAAVIVVGVAGALVYNVIQTAKNKKKEEEKKKVI